jgi:hypothetical protein
MKKVYLLIFVAVVLVGFVAYGMFFKNKESLAEPALQQGKLDVSAVCKNALAYMTFPDGETADKFVQDCIDGKYPDVIENYKAQLNQSGAAI